MACLHWRNDAELFFMVDKKTTISEMIDAVSAFEKERDWQKYHSPKNLAMGIAIEAGELMEHFQWLSEQESRELANDADAKHAIGEEMADVLAYLLNMADVMGIDLSDAFFAKMKRNAEKYPVESYRGRYKL